MLIPIHVRASSRCGGRGGGRRSWSDDPYCCYARNSRCGAGNAGLGLIRRTGRDSLQEKKDQAGLEWPRSDDRIH